jgi:hypothetical protein
MATPEISLMIYGTRLSSSGWEPLVMLNNPPFPPLENLGVSGIGETPTYYTVRIDQNYTQYTLVYNPKYIKAHAAQRNGALKVSISIPKGYKLRGKDGIAATPYNVFIDIQRTLEQQTLKPIVGRSGAFEFNADFPADDIFAQVLFNYKLVSAEMPHRPMSRNSVEDGIVLVNESQLDELFNDIQYPEFAPYKQIAFAKCVDSDSANTKLNIKIPREPNFEIFVNDVNKTKTIPSYQYGYNDPIVIDTLAVYRRDGRAYEGKILNFTVNDALKGTKYPKEIKVDRACERIDVKVEPPKERKVAYKILLKGCNKPEVYKDLRAYVSGKERSINSASGTLELYGEEIIAPNVIFNFVGTKFKLDGTPLININKEIIEVPVKELPRKVDDDISRLASSNESSDKVITFKFFLEDEKDIKDINRLHRIRLKNDYRTLALNCRFDPVKKRGAYCTVIAIPEIWAGSYDIDIRTDCIKSQTKRCNITSKTKELIITGNETDKLAWSDKFPKSLKPVLYVVFGFIIGVIALLTYNWIFGDDSSQDSTSSTVVVKPDAGGKTGNSGTSGTSGTTGDGGETTEANQINDQINQYFSALEDEAITFEAIKQMQTWINENAASLNDQNGDQFKRKIEAYIKVINYVESKDRTWQKIQQVVNENDSLINKLHLKHLQSIWDKGPNSKGAPILINGDEERIVNEELKAFREIKSFMDIPTSIDMLTNHHPNPDPNPSPSNPTKKNSFLDAFKSR